MSSAQRTAAARKIQSIFRSKRAFPENSGIMTKGVVNVSKVRERLEREFGARKPGISAPFVPELDEMMTRLKGKPVYKTNFSGIFLNENNTVTNANVQNALRSEVAPLKSSGIRFSKTKLLSFVISIHTNVNIHKILTEKAPEGGFGFKEIVGYTHIGKPPTIQYYNREWIGSPVGVNYIFAKRTNLTLRLSRDEIVIYGSENTKVEFALQRCVLNGWISVKNAANFQFDVKVVNGVFKVNKKFNLKNLNTFLYNSPLIEGHPSLRQGKEQMIGGASPNRGSSPKSVGSNSNSPLLNRGWQPEVMSENPRSNFQLRKELAKGRKNYGGGVIISTYGGRHTAAEKAVVHLYPEPVSQPEVKKKRARMARKTLKSLVFTLKNPKITFTIFENGTVTFMGLKKIEDIDIPKEIFKKLFEVAGSANTMFGSPTSKSGKTNSERLAERYKLVAGGNWNKTNKWRIPNGYYIRPGVDGKPRLYKYVKFLEGGALNKTLNLKAVAPKVKKAFENIGRKIPEHTLKVFRNAGAPIPVENKKVVYKNLSNRRASNWNAFKAGHYVVPGPGKQPIFKEIPKILGAAAKTVVKKYTEAGVNIPKRVRNTFSIPANVVTVGKKTHKLTVSNGELKINGKQAKRFTQSELLSIARNLKIAGATNSTNKKGLLKLLNAFQ